MPYFSYRPAWWTGVELAPWTAGSSGNFTDSYSLLLDGTTGYAAAADSSKLDLEYTQIKWMGGWVYINAWHSAVDFGKCEIMGKVLASTDATHPHRGAHLRATYLDPYFGRFCWYFVDTFTGVVATNKYVGIVTADYTAILQQWLRVDATHDGSGTAAGMQIYLNGVLQSVTTESDSFSGTCRSSALFGFGSRNGTENFFNGGINDPIIAGFVPTQNDINLVALSTAPTNAAAQAYTGALLGAWRNGDQDTGTTIKDYVGSADLTLHGGASFIADTQGAQHTFIPGNLDHLSCWLDANDLVPGAITTWTDKSGFGVVYTGTATCVASAINGQNGVQFNGTSDKLVGDGTSIILPKTASGWGLWVVVKCTGFPNHYPSVVSFKTGTTGSGAQNEVLGYSDDAAGPYTDVWFGSSTGNTSVGRAPLTQGAVTGAYHAICLNYSGGTVNSAASYTLTDNATSESIVSNGSVGAAGTTSVIGANTSGGTFLFQGVICEIVAKSNAFTTTDLTRLNGYKTAKYNL